jgi:hypothetical protein
MASKVLMVLDTISACVTCFYLTRQWLCCSARGLCKCGRHIYVVLSSALIYCSYQNDTVNCN